MKWWEPLADIYTSTVLFVGFGIPAVLIDLVVQWLPTIAVTLPIIFVLTGLKWVLVVADVLVVLIFIAGTVYARVVDLKKLLGL